MSPPLPTIPLVATDTTSMAPATRMSTGAPRVFTRGKLSRLTSPLLPTTPLVDMDTTSTAPATYEYRSPQGLHKREADASEPHYEPALAYHPAGGYGYNKYGPGYSYVYRSPQGLHKRE